MAFDEGLAERMREHLAGRPEITERKMFGGLCFLLDGKMFAGIVGDDLMLRIGPDAYADALARPHVREMDFTGRPMTGMIYVSAEGFESDQALASWLEEAAAFTRTATPSKPRKRSPKG